MIFVWLVVTLARYFQVLSSRRRKPKRFAATPRQYQRAAWWVVFYTNKARSRNKRDRLRRHLVLQASAQRHSDWMSSTKVFSHTGQSGTTPHMRMKTAGYPGNTTGENIYKYPVARGQRRLAKLLVAGWMNSPGHRANILNETFDYLGVGMRESGGYVWATQNFGGV